MFHVKHLQMKNLWYNIYQGLSDESQKLALFAELPFRPDAIDGLAKMPLQASIFAAWWNIYCRGLSGESQKLALFAELPKKDHFIQRGCVYIWER